MSPEADRWRRRREGSEARRAGGGGKSPLPLCPRPPAAATPHHLGQNVHGGAGEHVLHGHGGLPIRLGFQNLHQLLRFLIEDPHQADQGAGKQHTHQWPQGRAQTWDVPHRPSPEGAAWSCGPLPALLDAPQGPAHESGTQESNLTFTAPLLSGWLPSRYPDFNAPRIFRLPLGPSTPTSRRCGNAGTTADSGEGGTKGLWGHLESIESPSNLSVLAAHSPYLPCWGAPPQPFVIPRCSLPFGNHSAQPYVDVSLETQRSKPAAALTRDSYLPGLSACQTA